MTIEGSSRHGPVDNVWNTHNARSTWLGVIRRAADREVANRAMAELPEVTALEALEVNRELVELLTGRRWYATPDPRETLPVTLQATSAHAALHAAVDLIDALSQHADVAISTLHTLDGGPAAGATLAAREGFVDCAITDRTLTELITRN